MSSSEYDIVIVGAGAAGLFAAAFAARRGRRVLILEHARKPAEKVRISGGGRCNFTNRFASPEHYLSENPRFCHSALARYTVSDFIALVDSHRIAWHEKKLGQLFCDGSSQQIVNLLLEECRQPSVTLRLNTPVSEVAKPDSRFHLQVAGESIRTESLIVATGGLSIPKMGASGWGLDCARQFGLKIVPTRPALVPFVFSEEEAAGWPDMAGVAVESEVHCGRTHFREALLYTHRGLSGPSILQASSYWSPQQPVTVNLAPEHDLNDLLLASRQSADRRDPANFLSHYLPKRLAQRLVQRHLPANARLSQTSNAQIKAISNAVHQWRPQIAGTEGYRVAEVMAGGVDTRELSSTTMESKRVPGLYFIGEVVDVTGHLGGYNFQWAWSSAVAASNSA